MIATQPTAQRRATSARKRSKRSLSSLLSGSRIWFVIGCVAVLAITSAALAQSVPVRTHDLSLPVWLLIPMFFAVESFPIHIHYRREATSFSLYEIPAVLGMFFVPARVLFFAVAVGSVAALVLVRRQPAPKIVFNGANLVLQTAIALLIFDLALGSTSSATSPGGIIAAMAATLAGSLASVACIAAVIWAAEGRLNAAKVRDMFWFAAIVSVANASIGLAAVKLAESANWSVLLLGLPLLVLFASYRAFVKERTQREQVQFLHTATRSLQSNLSEDTAVRTLLQETASMFRASRVELLLFDEADVVDEATRYSLDLDGVTTSGLHDASSEIARQAAGQIDDAILAPTTDVDAITNLLNQFEVSDAMVGTLRNESTITGLLLVADRLGAVSSFGDEDLSLFRTLAQHAATAIENDRLGHALTQLRALESELSHLATHDSLTGLPNRMLLREHLDLESGHGACVELLFIDLDDFKLVNDSLGHTTGDLVLQEVARRISNELGPTDMAARLGGDEFAVALRPAGRGKELAATIIEQVRKPISAEGHLMSVDCSIGIAQAEGPNESANLLRRADVAMYAAKRSGKARTTTYHSSLGAELAERQETQQRLRFALLNNELRVFYQPIFSLGCEDRAVGAEALVRWETPDGVQSAGAFLEIAEESGQIAQIDRWVLGQVLRDLRTLRNARTKLDWVSVNVSARSLHEDDVVKFLCETVRNADVSPSSIVLEVTETAVMFDVEATIDKLHALREAGFGIALDDFGTGYSSINYLRRLPVTMVKIAQPFVADIETTNGEEFLQAIIDLVHRLGLPVVGEGIEEPTQLSELCSMACDLGQGFLLARPQAIADVSDLLARTTSPFEMSPNHPTLLSN